MCGVTAYLLPTYAFTECKGKIYFTLFLNWRHYLYVIPKRNRMTCLQCVVKRAWHVKNKLNFPQLNHFILHTSRTSTSTINITVSLDCNFSKGKAVPLQAWSGPEGSRKLRFPDFMTTAQDGGKVVSLTHRPPLPPGNMPGSHFCWRLS